ncbi:MAG: hypothetical protein WA988_03670 [Candidatus Nanopelagicales bacterium]
MSARPRMGSRRTLALLAGAVAASVALTPAIAAPNAEKPPTPPAIESVPQKLRPAKNSETRLQPNTVHLLRLLEHLFPYYADEGVIGGYRQDAIMDHPSGQALDVMMANGGRDPKSVNDGHQVAAFLMANASQLGVKYMVWRQSIWYPGQDWRLMSDRGHWTHNHMDHIHVLIDGAFQASDQLVLPKDLRVKLDELPNGEALREQAEKRIEIMVRSAQAQTRVTAATALNQKLTNKNSKRAKELEAAQDKVSQAVRESYIFGMDSNLLASSLMLMSGTNTDPTISLALERTIRSQDEGLTVALASLAAAARELSENELELSDARADLEQANKELAELDAS